MTHIGDIELKVGSSNVENECWEDEGPISTIGLHEREQKSCPEVADGAGEHYGGIVHQV